MQKKQLKICHVITRMIVGGAQENTLLSVVGAADNRNNVVLLTGPSNGPEGKLLEKNRHLWESKKNIEIIETPLLTREINPIIDIKAYYFLKKFFLENKFDVVHTHSSKAGIIGRLAAFKAKVPCIVHTIHGQAFHQYEKKWKNKLYILAEKFAAQKCHRIFAVANAMIDQSVKQNIVKRDKCKVVYSGMEIEKFLNAKRDIALMNSLGLSENDFVIGTLARLFPLKGYDNIVKIAERVIDKSPNVKFLIIGDGIMMSSIKQELDKAGIINNFIFAGLVTPDRVQEYLAQINILLHLSLREGLPRAVVQSLAVGKPAIAFNLDGTPEVIIDEKTGYVLSPNDMDGVVSKLIYLINNEEKAKEMGLNGRELVKDKFDWKNMCKILESEYIDILSKNSY